MMGDESMSIAGMNSSRNLLLKDSFDFLLGSLSRCSRFLGTSLRLAFVVLMFASLVAGQQSGASLSGIVTDPSGAVITTAKVTATNDATGVTITTTTNSSGYYSFPALQPGTYTVRVSATGFKTSVQQNVVLYAQTPTQLPFKLTLGNTTQTVTVKAAPPALSYSSASLAEIVPPKAITSLPLMGQNVYSLLTVAPGITGLGTLQSSPNTGNDVFATTSAPAINAGGRSYESNLFTLNGNNTTATPVGGTAQATPLPDTVSEMRISTNDYDAAYGGAAGMVVNVTTKSGTNQYHGDLFEYHTDSALSSRNVFQSTPGSVHAFRRNEFGGTLGGPILKNRVFMFGSLDLLRSSGASSFVTNFETPQFTNFVATEFPNSIAAKILKGYGPGPGITLTNIETLSQYYQANPGYYFPTLQSAEALGFSPDMPTVGQGTFTPTGTRNGTQWTLRPDFYFNQQKDHLFYYVYRSSSDALSEDPRPAFNGTNPSYTMTMNLNEVHTFSPSIINEASVGYYRTYGAALNPASALVVPGVNVNGVWGWGGNGGFEFSPGDFVQNVYNWNDMVTMIKGAHTFKMGFGARRWEDNANFTGIYQRGDYYFNNLVDFSQDMAYSSTFQGVDPTTGKPTSQVRGYRGTELDAFINDNWKVRHDLSLNLGLRWDYFGNPSEATNKQENFLFGSGSTFIQRLANGSAQVVPALYANARHDNFAPRFGFSWNPSFDQKLVLRGGFGLFYDRPSNQIYTNNRTNPPLFAVPTWGVPTGTPVAFGLCSPTSSLDVNCPQNPDLNQVTLNSANGLVAPINGVPTLIPTELYGTTQQFPISYSENWNMGVQYGITHDLVAEIDYIGDVAHRNYLSTDINRFNGDNVGGFLRRPNPNFADIQLSQPIGNSNFNAMSVGFRRIAPHGITFSGYYTWSHAFDLCSDYLQGGCSIPDISDIMGNYASSDFDVRNHFAGYATWTVPQLFQNNKWMNRLLTNWTINGVVAIQSGMPFSVVCYAGYPTCDYNLDGYNYDRPSINGPVKLAASHLTVQNYLNGIFLPGGGQFGTQFYAPTGVQEGNLGRNTFRGPGLADVDFSLERRFPIYERTELDLTIESFNAFNRVNLGQVDGSMTDSTFGQSTSVAGNPRTYQVVAKILF